MTRGHSNELGSFLLNFWLSPVEFYWTPRHICLSSSLLRVGNIMLIRISIFVPPCPQHLGFLKKNKSAGSNLQLISKSLVVGDCDGLDSFLC